MIITLLTGWALSALYLRVRYPLTPAPRYRFNHWLPRLLNTGAVTMLGFCYVRADIIHPKHRAHEEFHHRRVVALGRWRHLAQYVWQLVLGWFRDPTRTTDEWGRRYWSAYYWHPEEVAARVYAEAMMDTYDELKEAA